MRLESEIPIAVIVHTFEAKYFKEFKQTFVVLNSIYKKICFLFITVLERASLTLNSSITRN